METPTEQTAFVTFEPFSPNIIKLLGEQRDLKSKLHLFDIILNDHRAEVVNETDKAKTVVFPGHKGSQHKTWQGTKEMAQDINNCGESVAFLSELKDVTSADAVVLFKGKPVVADFKYCVTTKSNTLAGELASGFKQANTVVLKLENMDAGLFKDAVNYLIRNNIGYGNIKLINKNGKKIDIEYLDIRSGKYQKMIKGFLK